VFDEWCSVFKVLLTAVSHTASAACPGLSPFTMQSLGNLIFGHLRKDFYILAFLLNDHSVFYELQHKNKAVEKLRLCSKKTIDTPYGQTIKNMV
jgi:hypothetical protein